ncbi:MAG: helix-turn-helix domain-containing protein [Pleurocapsa sp. SU_196_0]|nr:helix-turn-helix domain-containing protein [Pleurocapsa sp. SU_196_0]
MSDFLTIKQAAEAFGKSEKTIRRMIERFGLVTSRATVKHDVGTGSSIVLLERSSLAAAFGAAPEPSLEQQMDITNSKNSENPLTGQDMDTITTPPVHLFGDASKTREMPKLRTDGQSTPGQMDRTDGQQHMDTAVHLMQKPASTQHPRASGELAVILDPSKLSKSDLETAQGRLAWVAPLAASLECAQCRGGSRDS